MSKGKSFKSKMRVVTFHGVKSKIYYSPVRGRDSYELVFYRRPGERKKERHSTVEAAEASAKVHSQQLLSGASHVVALSATDAARLRAAREILHEFPGVEILDVVQEWAAAMRELGKLQRQEGRVDGETTEHSLLRAASHYVSDTAGRAVREIMFPDLVNEYLPTLKWASERHQADMRGRLNVAKRAFNMKLGLIESRDIEAWLSGMNVKPRTRLNFRTALTTLFSYARTNGYLPENIKTAAEKVRKPKVVSGPPGIYTPSQLSAMLAKIDECWIPFVTIAAFTGVRTAELHRLNWQDVWLDKGVIDLPSTKSKTPSNRRLTIFPNLREWLLPYAAKASSSDPICPKRFSHDSTLAAEFAKATDAIGFVRKNNGFRHSFGSYLLARTKNVGEVTREMGNSPRMLFSHYHALATADEAESWFSITPVVRRASPVPKRKSQQHRLG